MKTLALLGTVTGIALLAGIRLYATVLTVGLCLPRAEVELTG